VILPGEAQAETERRWLASHEHAAYQRYWEQTGPGSASVPVFHPIPSDPPPLQAKLERQRLERLRREHQAEPSVPSQPAASTDPQLRQQETKPPSSSRTPLFVFSFLGLLWNLTLAPIFALGKKYGSKRQ